MSLHAHDPNEPPLSYPILLTSSLPYTTTRAILPAFSFFVIDFKRSTDQPLPPASLPQILQVIIVLHLFPAARLTMTSILPKQFPSQSFQRHTQPKAKNSAPSRRHSGNENHISTNLKTAATIFTQASLGTRAGFYNKKFPSPRKPQRSNRQISMEFSIKQLPLPTGFLKATT